jgi:hypothetical protein
MTKAGDKLIAGLQEAVAVAKGEIEPARVHVFGEEKMSDELIERLRMWSNTDVPFNPSAFVEAADALASQSTRIAELERALLRRLDERLANPTPAMLKAGARIFTDYHEDFDTVEDTVDEIFRAMLSAAAESEPG